MSMNLSNKTVISVEHLTKRYDLGVIGTGTVSRDLNRWWARVRGNEDPYAKIGAVDHGNCSGGSIFALDDVSFTVEQGEVLGIIGRNGAGKSTLLKILSQVTAPTSGKVKVKGRIGSLLEVGTGFHPELTGRENVYLNGAILGMSRTEVARKFDEIVDFSGVEKFIDTPVKRYSSGMYVRLAFSVAAHLEPEILIVDEVLAVGDVEFQKKCLGKMGNVAHEGRTVLFVSHNMASIIMLCKTCMLLNQGKIVVSGKTATVIQEYTNFSGRIDSININHGVGHFLMPKYQPITVTPDSSITMEVDLRMNVPIKDYRLFFIIHDEMSNTLVHSVVFGKDICPELNIGLYHIKILLPQIWLRPGNYNSFFKLVSLEANRIRIISPTKTIESIYHARNEDIQGILNPKVEWLLKKTEEV